MKKLIKLINCIIYVLEQIKRILDKVTINKRYYVYNTYANKPKIIHHSYESAENEAKRIAGIEPSASFYGSTKKIQVLEIVSEFECTGVPF